MSRNYYINQIKDLSTNFDDKTKSNILTQLDKIRGNLNESKKMYNLLLEDVYGDNGIEGY